MQAQLPRSFMPDAGFEPVRLGRSNDGGYVIDRKSLYAAQQLISFGINDDWSFEQDFIRHNRVPVAAYDGSINLAFFVKQAIYSLVKLYNPLHLIDKIRRSIGYLMFFRGEIRHIRSHVGISSPPGYVSFAEVISSISSDDAAVFLKIDIEGGEYRILDDIVAIADRLTGLVIEFHDVDINLEKIERFIADINLGLCHVHCNNYEPLNEHRIPLALELTFTQYGKQPETGMHLPIQQDMPNNPAKQDYPILFTADAAQQQMLQEPR